MSELPRVVRRTFLGRLAAVGGALGAALTGTAVLPDDARAATSRGETHPADAWLDAFKGPHKNIYDCTSVEKANDGFTYGRNFLTANTGEIYKYADSDLNVIVSLRHFATAFGFNDAMWAKYPLGELVKVNDGAAPATKNLRADVANDLAKRGVVVTNRAQEKGFAYTYIG